MKNMNYNQKKCRIRQYSQYGILLCLLFISPFSPIGAKPIVTESTQVRNDERIIKGVVKDVNGEALIGVSVKAKSTNVTTITDLNGNFEIKVQGSDALIFSYIGFNVLEVSTSGKDTLEVILHENTKELDEVVVVGYGVQKKKLTTGATIQVSGNDLQKLSTSSAIGAMQSQTPGVNITQSSGMPGEGFKVNIRGIGTTGNSNPLYVIDGVAGGDINLLNPSDIESIDVLKDAATSAIYGARAANGVILVTTKQAKAGKIQASYDGYVGWQNVYKMPSLLNAQQYMSIMNEIRFNEGTPLIDFASVVPNEYKAVQNGWNGTNWLDEIRNKNAVTQNHSINLTGGSETSKFAMGFSYSAQDGIIGKPVAPDYSRYTFRINSDHVLLKVKDFDAIKIGENLTYTHTTNAGIGIGNQYWNDIHNVLIATPLMPVYNSNGGYFDQPSKVATDWGLDGAMSNPIADMVYQRGLNKSKNYALQANTYVQIQPIKNLIFRSSFGYKQNSSSYRSYTPVYDLSTTNKNVEDRVVQNMGLGHNWTLDNTVSYAWNIEMKHNFDAVIGQSMEKWGMGEDLEAENRNSLFPGSWDHAWIGNTQGINSTNTRISGQPWGEGSIASFFGRVNYNFNETYMASVIMRTDGSSNFAKGNRWGYFPSVSLGWVPTNEAFMNGTKSWLDFFKLRASWGQNGNCNIDPFQYLATISFDTHNAYYWGNNKGQLINGGYPDILPNADVTWEKSEQWDIGFDSYFLNSRLGVIFDWYTKNTKDWLVRAPILASYGTGAPYINGGYIRNQGIEVAFNWNDKFSRDFRYGANFNFTYNKNEVIEIDNTEGIIHGPEHVLSQGTKEMFRAQVGYPIGYFWGYKTDGVFQNQAQINEYKAAGKGVLNGAQAGDLIFVDTNNDGTITDDDKVQIGNPNPKFKIGFSMNFEYKGVDLSFVAYGAFGHQIAKSYRSFADSPLQNYTTDIFDRWHGEGTSNKLPRLTSGSHSNWQNISDIYIEDADFLKLQNVTIGYDFKKLFPQMPLTQARLYFTAQNLFTITGYSGMDPEIGYGYSNETPWASGIDVGFYPSPRTYLVGVNLKF
ncbi:TonB-dependent receptor [uncultured Dysgonomonas sp.]|uniref:TonB-dependent receptor plug n=1 Tax=uncultured Dysgonomonas sp. TaxID=206096 RepID=A0A212K5L1_9BACT|nr:TonB-dependent receptor [uncultured Dysgonomonas sp.]SBW06991.1 TonB-dependent receptor plug [uncultured Dysgonomonas sp.]